MGQMDKTQILPALGNFYLWIQNSFDCPCIVEFSYFKSSSKYAAPKQLIDILDVFF